MCLCDVKVEQLLEARTLTAAERLEAVLAAELNDDRASLCTPDQPALRKLFEMNAALFRKLAR